MRLLLDEDPLEGMVAVAVTVDMEVEGEGTMVEGEEDMAAVGVDEDAMIGEVEEVEVEVEVGDDHSHRLGRLLRKALSRWKREYWNSRYGMCDHLNSTESAEWKRR